jgi:hypothetical protein
MHAKRYSHEAFIQVPWATSARSRIPIPMQGNDQSFELLFVGDKAFATHIPAQRASGKASQIFRA